MVGKSAKFFYQYEGVLRGFLKMLMFILNLIGGLAAGIGLYQIYDSILISILAVVVLNGAPQIWFLHNIWYAVFEFFKIGKLTMYGYITFAIWLLIIITTIFLIKRNKF
ncbi:hypothetical protein [Campylobacter sp. RM16192]|uniref:hypothetical protein n=1 Tax=Campylobacter sp. RM16192 TaxID=1660080 RepID=UPI0014529DA8|nr:hypothetical protein [Campylobacter sp. RM16192]QCD52495.1 putative membrane protein [Campylobacter sp. RM16192]